MYKLLSNTKGDRWIWLIVILLSVISLLAVYSAIGSLAYKKGVGSCYDFSKSEEKLKEKNRRPINTISCMSLDSHIIIFELFIY